MTGAATSTTMTAPYDAVVLDLDGVVTDTASTHAAAWKQLFDEVLADPRAGTIGPVEPFDIVEDCRRYVDGRQRQDGVIAFVESRGIVLPLGAPDDPPDAWTVNGLARRKNDLFLDMVATHGVRAFPGTVALVRRLRGSGTPLALVTDSRNADAVLDAAGLGDIFDVVVDGDTAAERGLAGKPDPAMFLEAASELGVDPARTAVLEDAVAGVQAAAAGGFGLVVGINRAGQRTDLERAGAHFVLDDVSELDLGASRSDPWLLVYNGFDPVHESHREALTTLGNGYLGTRGAMAEHVADGLHYPGTYLAGVYNRLTSVVDGQEREDEELVNAPNWLWLDLCIGNTGWWSQDMPSEEHERRELDLRRGVLSRATRLVDTEGRVLHVRQNRLVSMDRPHLMGLETVLTAEGWSGPVSVRSGVDASSVNGNAPESALLANHHLSDPEVEHVGETLVVEVETVQSRIRIATAVRTTVTGAAAVLRFEDHPARPSLRLDLTLTDGQPVGVHKLVAVATDRDPAVASARAGALAELARAPRDFEELVRRHELAWQRLWEDFVVDVDSDDPVQLAVNLHVFHVLQTTSRHTVWLDSGIPARGLHGEGYRGHVFWDELFVLPLLIMRAPEVARSKLDYRWRRLDAARKAAQESGCRGAMFPWQSGSDGREETPSRLFNPRSQRWIPDNSHRQRHIGLAVAYMAWQYYQATADRLWFGEHGAELIIEVARFFSDLATLDESDQRYHIHGVMGPDEYHDGYPDAPGQGLRDNTYTNVLAAWVCGRATEALRLLSPREREQLAQRIGLELREVERWRDLSRGMAVAFHDGVISQFEGYGDLIELDWETYRRRYGNIGRLDLILEAEGDSTNRYRLSKQADVLMLVYLLGPSELRALLTDLGYPTTEDDLARTVDHYLARTTNGSTLSRVVHTSVLAMLDRTTAWSELRESLVADLDDIQGGTTGHGIHLGAMAGTVDIFLRTFAGLRVQADALVFQPRPPGALRGVTFRLKYRGQRITVDLDHRVLRLTSDAGAELSPAAPVNVQVNDVAACLAPGQRLEFDIACSLRAV